MENQITITAIAAWWGAGIATLVFAWDIIKWRHAGARLRLTVSPNMQHMGLIANWIDPNQTLVTVSAVNIGAKRTTITNLFACYFPSWWAKRFGKASKTMVIPLPMGSQPIPFELEPGARWVGSFEQTDELEQMSRSGYLYVDIHHSMAKGGQLARLKVPAAA